MLDDDGVMFLHKFYKLGPLHNGLEMKWKFSMKVVLFWCKINSILK